MLSFDKTIRYNTHNYYTVYTHLNSGVAENLKVGRGRSTKVWNMAQYYHVHSNEEIWRLTYVIDNAALA